MQGQSVLVVVLFQASARISSGRAVFSQVLQVLDSIPKSVENRHFDIIICIANLHRDRQKPTIVSSSLIRHSELQSKIKGEIQLKACNLFHIRKSIGIV